MPTSPLCELDPSAVRDRDGNDLRRGTLAISGGDTWVIGSVGPRFIRLDRRLPNRLLESRLIGRKRFCCIHPTGIPAPLIFR